MSKLRFAFNILAIAVFSLAISSVAQAQASRTWVSGVGDDVNPCSRTAPCKTFAGAISKTATCGEISVLDPGGFGAVTIGKGITIDGDGTLAGILSANVNAIIVNAPTTDDVIIRSISINGVCNGLNGIRFLNGRHLHVENVTIYDITQNAIDVSLGAVTAGNGLLSVENCSFTNIGGVGVRVTSASGTPNVQIDHTRINRANFGVDVIAGSTTVSNSAISFVTGQAIVAELSATANAFNCVLNNNGTGIEAFTANTSTIRFANCAIFNNTFGVKVAGGATGDRFGSSAVFGNGTDTSGTTNLRTNQ